MKFAAKIEDIQVAEGVWAWAEVTAHFFEGEAPSFTSPGGDPEIEDIVVVNVGIEALCDGHRPVPTNLKAAVEAVFDEEWSEDFEEQLGNAVSEELERQDEERFCALEAKWEADRDDALTEEW